MKRSNTIANKEEVAVAVAGPEHAKEKQMTKCDSVISQAFLVNEFIYHVVMHNFILKQPIRNSIPAETFSNFYLSG